MADSKYQTYQAIGNREDLTDIIENISPLETYVTSNTKTVSAAATYHEWQQDALAAAAANAAVEGADATATSATPTTREGNYTQILQKTYMVTETQDKVNSAGRKSELNYQTQKNLKELAKDIEYALVVNATAASGASGTARTLKGIAGWIATNVTTGSATGTQALTEDMYNDNLELIWAQGGLAPFTTLCGSFQKRQFDSFTTNTRYAMADEKKLTSAVNVYESSFGVCQVRLHHTMNTSLADQVFTLGDMDLWCKANLRPTKRREIAKVGDADKYQLICEMTLESRAEKGSGKITELTVT